MTPSDTTPREDGWIEWTGGENPVGDQVVQRRYRDGIVGEPMTTQISGRPWKHYGDDADIIAYRVVSPAPAAPANGGGESVAWSEDHPIAKAVIAARQRACSDFSPEFSGQRFADFDRGLLAAYAAVGEAVAALQPQPTQQGGEEVTEAMIDAALSAKAVKGGAMVSAWMIRNPSDREPARVMMRAAILAALKTPEARG